MPPYVKKTWMNGRENGAAARLNATEMNLLETRIEAAIGTGTSGGVEVVNAGSITTDTTLPMGTHQDVLWFVTLGAAGLKLEISGWTTGKSVTLVIQQDGTGGRTLASLPTARWDGTTGIPTASLGANAIDVRTFFRGVSDTFGFDSGSNMT